MTHASTSTSAPIATDGFVLHDEDRAAIAHERGESITPQGVRYLRLANEIPPPSEPYRSRWLSEREGVADETP